MTSPQLTISTRRNGQFPNVSGVTIWPMTPGRVSSLACKTDKRKIWFQLTEGSGGCKLFWFQRYCEKQFLKYCTSCWKDLILSRPCCYCHLNWKREVQNETLWGQKVIRPASLSTNLPALTNLTYSSIIRCAWSLTMNHFLRFLPILSNHDNRSMFTFRISLVFVFPCCWISGIEFE
jgi:hypothetical protein